MRGKPCREGKNGNESVAKRTASLGIREAAHVANQSKMLGGNQTFRFLHYAKLDQYIWR
jgi:hypothetical protein